MIRGRASQEYKSLIKNHGGFTDNNLLEIRKGQTKYFLTIKVLSKEKRSKRRIMHNTRNLKPIKFAARIQ